MLNVNPNPRERLRRHGRVAQNIFLLRTWIFRTFVCFVPVPRM